MATIPEDMMRVDWIFNLEVSNVPQDIAVFTLHGHRNHRTGTVIDWQADIEEVANKSWDRWADNVDAANFSGGARLAEVSAYHLSTANKTLNKGTRVEDGSNPWVGDVPSGLPWETSLCTSLYAYPHGTFVQDQRSKRGRFYMPPLANTVLQNDGSGAVQASKVTALMADIGAFLNGMQGLEIGGATPADYFELAVLSPKTESWYQVIEYGIDQVIDSQRRRRKSQIAVKQWADINVAS